MSGRVPVVVVHGGAEPFLRYPLSAEKVETSHASLQAALIAGHTVLAAHGSALDAVTEAVKVLEDAPIFNSARGAAYTSSSTHEMDSSIMDGRGRRAGAVAGICGPRHPVLAARAVMERTKHVLLTGVGAAQFCRDIGLEHCDDSWFGTDFRRAELESVMKTNEVIDHGTVGAVAFDEFGGLAAATSTGGMTGKLPGRVGDSPIIGAGTWADEDTCAVSSTGHGEFFIRYGVAHEIHGRMRWGRQSLETAANGVINETLTAVAAEGGVIAVDASGHIALPFNSPGMFRGYVHVGTDVIHTAICREDFRELILKEVTAAI